MSLEVARDVRDIPINLSYEEAKHYSQIFKSFDKDQEGHISMHDLRKALSNMEVKISDGELRDLITEVNANKNCTIEETFLQLSILIYWILYYAVDSTYIHSNSQLKWLLKEVSISYLLGCSLAKSQNFEMNRERV